jgi:cullin 3
MSKTSTRTKINIKPFRHQVTMDPNFAENTWLLLKNAIHEIHRKNASNLSFEELYRNAYNLVLHKYGDRLYNGLKQVVDEHLKGVAQLVAQANDDYFLQALNEAWNDHHQSMLMIRDILMYLDRVYVTSGNCLTVYDLGLSLFKENVARFPKIGPRLLDMLLESIRRERCGEVINRVLIKHNTQMLVDLGTQNSKQKSVYEEDFEKHFLDASTKFYRVESQNFISENTASDYLRKAEFRILEEIERVKHYLDASTEQKIKEVVDAELIHAHMKTIIEMQGSGLVAMLKDDKLEDLARMYKLLQNSKGHDMMRTVFGNFVRETGKAIVTDPANEGKQSSFVQALLDLKAKYDKILTSSFGNERNFQHTLNQAFDYFVNLNPRSPEYISLFIDEKLCKGTKSGDEDSDLILNKVMQIFRFLQEKDVFERYYKQHLAKRLLLNKSVSDDAERNMISKLKAECGNAVTSKLEGMFQDMKISADTSSGFKQHLSNFDLNPLQGVDLNVHVLTSGYWPTQVATSCNLPLEISRCCDEFKKFYLGKHSGRRLTWQTNMGTAEMKATYGPNKHFLTCSTYQICILLLFNEHDTLTFTEIQTATGISAPDLKRSLWTLIVQTTKILLKEPRVKTWSDTDKYTYNDAFKCKTSRVNLLPQTTADTTPERTETQQKVDEDRRHMIEAAIVRIMKARKSFAHVQLIEEVTKQLSSRFRPNPLIIKKRIESLIEREYLERSSTDRKSYNYLA